MRFPLLCTLACTLAAPLAAQEGAEKYRIDPNVECYRHIRDNTVFAWKVKSRELGNDADLYFEERAYEEMLLHAARFPHEELEAHARRDVLFGSLFATEASSYRLQLMRFEGRLRRLVRVDVLESMKQQGVDATYEAWVFPTGEPAPLCLIMSQLPPGLEPMKDVRNETIDLPVAVTGYFFKLARYEEMRKDKTDPTRHRMSVAPTLIGRSITVLPEGALAEGAQTWRAVLLPALVGGIVLLGVTLFILNWRYNRGDKEILAKAREKRNQNPFENVSETLH